MAACALSALPGVGNHALNVLREHHGSLARALAFGGKELSRTPGLRAGAATALESATKLEERGRWLVDEAARIGAHILVRGMAGYPPLLEAVPGSPPVLYVLGKLDHHGAIHRRVAVVGSRRADDYALHMTRTVVDHLAGAGIEIVSGGAQGVDSAAHARSLEVGARTVAVLGVGLLRHLSGGHRRLFDAVARSGAVVSEFALDAGGQKSHFPQRNRTIAGLSEAVVITRGVRKSGARQTCLAAHRFGRPVFAIPGNVTDERSVTPNELIRDGIARATLDGSEVARTLGLGTAPPAAVRETEPASSLQPGARAVLEALGPAPRHVDDIARQAKLGVGETLAELLSLEMAGLCVARPGKYFVRR